MATLLDNENIIAALGIESLSDDQKAAIVEKVSDLVQKRLLARVFESLPEPDQSELGRLLESGDEASVQAFLAAHVPAIGEWLVEEISLVKQELKDWVASLDSNA